MRKIFLDLDGVVVNFEKAIIELFNITPSEEVSNFLSQRDPAINLAELVGGKPIFWKKVNQAGEDFWANMELFPWGMDLWHDLNKLCPEVFILTAPSTHPLSVSGKVRLIQKYFKTNKFLIGSGKYACAAPNHLLVDDTPKKLDAFAEHQGKTYRFPYCSKIMNNEISYERIINEIKQIYYTMEEN